MRFFGIFATLLLTALNMRAEDEELPEIGDRIIGGMDAKPNELPYQLAFRIPEGVACGASLIHPQYALTAAHCTVMDMADITIVGGEHKISKPEKHEQERKVIQIIDHENYNEGTISPDTPTFAHDISILKLDRPMDLNKYVALIAMAPADYKASGDATVSGWGYLNKLKPGEEQAGSDKLMKLTLPLIDVKTCAEKYKKVNHSITKNMLCAGFLGKGGKDACSGDSGGPLVVSKNRKPLLIGVVSAGKACALKHFPGVYTSVAAYRSWIDSRIK